MFTVAELTAAMEESGRRLTPRTARNWWSIGILPRPQRTGLGRGKGTVSFWPDRRVLHQAQIAYDLLDKGVTLQRIAAAVWLVVGSPVRIDIVRKAFASQIAGYYRRGRGRSRDDLEADDLEADHLWKHVKRFVRQDAWARNGSEDDDEGVALYALTGELLELLFGVGDGAPSLGDSRQWSEDTTDELQSRIEFLARLSRDGSGALPVVRAETVEEAVTWISENASLRRQRDAVRKARRHDWTRARRITRIAIGLLDRAIAAASPEQHVNNRALFTRLAVTWARFLFPVLLALVRNPKQRRLMAKTMSAAAAIVRAGQGK
jgi:hypothetical protein